MWTALHRLFHFDDSEVLQLVSSSLPLVTIDHVFNNWGVHQSENRQGR